MQRLVKITILILILLIINFLDFGPASIHKNPIYKTLLRTNRK